jgi:PhzF family phenazine biosynthesis protein
MKRIPFQQVDVFTRVPFKGNPVAVVLDAEELSTAEMQAIANWTNLSETTFVLHPTDPSADYRLRIFSPRAELPFAGHPTMGSAHAVLGTGRATHSSGRIIQECGKGLIEIRIDGEQLFFRLPQPAFTSPDESLLARAAEALGIRRTDIERAAVVDVGPVWVTLQLRNADAVINLKPDMAAIADLSHGVAGVAGLNVFGLHDPGAAAQIEVRSFAPADGVPEDPVCGSGNGCVAAVVRRDHLLDRSSYVASQGRCLLRDGRVEVRFADDICILRDGRMEVRSVIEGIWIGGNAVTCAEGTLKI